MGISLVSLGGGSGVGGICKQCCLSLQKNRRKTCEFQDGGFLGLFFEECLALMVVKIFLQVCGPYLLTSETEGCLYFPVGIFCTIIVLCPFPLVANLKCKMSENGRIMHSRRICA